MGAPDRLISLPIADSPLIAASLGWAALIESLPEAAWLVDGRSTLVVTANTAAHRLLGAMPGHLMGERAESLLVTPEDLAYWSEALNANPGELQSEADIRSADGQTRRVMRSIRPFVHGGCGTFFYMVVLTDLTEHHRTEQQLQQTLSELQATLESTADGILVTDLSGHIRAFNRRFSRMWTLPQALLLEPRDDEAVHAWMRDQVQDVDAYDTRQRALANAARMTAIDRLHLKSGLVLERAALPLWHHGQPVGRVYSFRDLSERLAADQRIAELSQTDALTGLPNRAELSAAVERAARQAAAGGPGFALMLVDLDRFSLLNETLGATTADLVLLEVARRLRLCLRQGDLAARLGSDQFALLIHEADTRAAEATARRLLDAVSATTQVDGMPFTLTCSIGVAVSPLHGTGADDLLGNADEAMRRAKAAGRATWRMHTLRRASDPRVPIRMDHAMRQALAHERFRVYYQPQIDTQTGAVVGAEALLRWYDAAFGGDVSPARFIPVAEDSGLIVALGDWVLRQAVQQAAIWQKSGVHVPVAVNVSALQFHQPDFLNQVAGILAQHDLAPKWLELEVTESILLKDADDTLARLSDLAALGLRLSIDDFGTGYSNLAYLKRLPVHKLKIDRSFVSGLPSDGRDAGIVTAILQLARALGMDAIAEGVENPQQLQFLQQAGCAHFQGYLFAPALDPVRFETRWRSSRVSRPG